jgi:periplasmic protein TonB
MSAAVASVSFRAPSLPWAPSIEDDSRFRRVLHRVLALVVLLCLAMLFVPPPKLDRTQPQELPPRLAKLLLEKATVPPPPPVKKDERAAEKAAPQPESQREVAKPTPPKKLIKGAEVPEARNPQPNKPPGEIGEARRKASGVGLLAMKDQLAEIHGAPVAVQLRQDIKQGPGGSSGTTSSRGRGSPPASGSASAPATRRVCPCAR